MRLRLKARLQEAQGEEALLDEEIRLKDARMGSLDPHRRPHYRPTERLVILELRDRRGWSCALTARRFLVEPETIAEWVGRLDEQGPSALVQTPEPVNRFADFVRYMVRRLRVLSPSMGKKRMAQTLARAGLHLGVSTVARMLKEKEDKRTPERSAVSREASCPVKAEYSNHLAG